MIIYRPEQIPCLQELLLYWEKRAKEEGLRGISFIYQQRFFDHQKDKGGELFDYGIEYQPGYAMEEQKKSFGIVIRKLLNVVVNRFKLRQTKLSTIIYDYDKTWQYILKMSPKDKKMIPGAFVDWDNTPRYKGMASLFQGVTPKKFEKYLSLQIQNAKQKYHKDMIFLFAWNEWGEGGYLEPDELNGYGMLAAIKNALDKNQEFPQYPI